MIEVIAYFSLGVAVFGVFAGPFLIGKPQKDYTAVGYVITLVSSLATIVLAGRVLGWW